MPHRTNAFIAKIFQAGGHHTYELPNKPEWKKKYEHNQGRQIHYCTSSEKWFCYNNLVLFGIPFESSFFKPEPTKCLPNVEYGMSEFSN